MTELARDHHEPSVNRALVLDEEGMRRALTRMGHEIVERNGADGAVLLAGIPTRGVPLARRLAGLVSQLGARVDVLELDVQGHRDDRPVQVAMVTHSAADDAPPVAGRVVVLVDDVIFHGRTARAALDALTELGRPSAVQLAVMVDRGHRELPIRADYVGKNIPTALSDRVEVHVSEIDGHDGVVVVGGGERPGV